MYKVTIKNSGDYRFDVTASGSGFVIDLGGAGITPPDALLASVGSCLGVYIRKYAQGAHLDIDSFTVSVEAHLTKELPVRFSEISVEVTLDGANLDERRRDALLHFIKNCPVHNTIKMNPDVIIAIR